MEAHIALVLSIVSLGLSVAALWQAGPKDFVPLPLADEASRSSSLVHGAEDVAH